MLSGTPDGDLPHDLPAALVELLAELREADPGSRPALSAAAARLANLLAPRPLFAL